MLREILKPSGPARVVAGAVAEIAPDVLVLQDVDYDASLAGLRALADLIQDEGGPLYPHLFARLPNSGMPSGFDLDGDGLLGGPRDAQGYGRFEGDGGMAILSLYPMDEDGIRDFSDLLWDDLPDAIAPEPPFPSPQAAAARRLSSVGHWVVPVTLPSGPLHLMTWSATPPIFDGPEDLNGRRNHDEAALWLRLLDGDLGDVPDAPFVILGNANLDPVDGDGVRGALTRLLADPRLQDPKPRGDPKPDRSGQVHRGDPALDTAAYDGAGNLRVSYVLPSADIVVRDSGVFWPKLDALGKDDLGPRHAIVWADLTLR
ncbi:endonuclease/exonuclease/phosphatase family protein [Maribius pontilimi]|uniref:Endonuclease/exonuclease/phosphatase family protein n=1 Tax=Palleronia pontilimi TaxID=1964209 RepID=A0A934M8J0_9RHOB|nr:endonuclease/exonuclease/phosphatase family protein [Palleronia pontilimi]MBJ3761462.1 endonuclease/exonuclease/phosphatase family protein [Palleronia pontilimi]